ncbi:hypothetical protein NLJ89_g8718 [Agrocybe chaxingu]|uniref:DUF6593 domain-containing protein n=1 Tax=Agrocybe chaxingu TaxID=84603 RepID=A0A9W8JX18_9AGAR|nr:hypothetical protein NLJ89_g8718 [Agrocybe chaxingu]
MDEEWKTSEFFRKEGWGWYGSNRIFTGSDGKEYRWKMGSSVSELFLHDTAKDTTKHDSKTHVPLLVARFHDPQVSMYQKRRPASLEIFPVGEHMVELILITFIYIEKMRTDRQNSAVRSTRIVTTPPGTKGRF